MLTILSRIIHYGVKNFWRNGLLSAATVAIMVLALLVFSGLILFRVAADAAASSIQDKIDISAYFKTNVSEDQILNVKQSLESIAEVKSVEYVSRDKALEDFKAKHSGDAVISQGINELDSNPLEASLRIKARKPDQYTAIKNYLNSQSIAELLDKQPIDSENQVVIDRLAAIVNNVQRGGFLLALILAVIAGLVVFNTIRIAIYSNREEIGIMRVVGASNALVRGPSMVEGIISGALGSVISLFVMAPVAYFISPHLEIFIPGLNIFGYFYAHIVSLFFYQIIFGVGIGAFSSFMAVRRYLKN